MMSHRRRDCARRRWYVQVHGFGGRHGFVATSVWDNQAAEGGAFHVYVYAYSGVATVSGGAFHNNAGRYGGGLYMRWEPDLV